MPNYRKSRKSRKVKTFFKMETALYSPISLLSQDVRKYLNDEFIPILSFKEYMDIITCNKSKELFCNNIIISKKSRTAPLKIHVYKNNEECYYSLRFNSINYIENYYKLNDLILIINYYFGGIQIPELKQVRLRNEMVLCKKKFNNFFVKWVSPFITLTFKNFIDQCLIVITEQMSIKELEEEQKMIEEIIVKEEDDEKQEILEVAANIEDVEIMIDGIEIIESITYDDMSDELYEKISNEISPKSLPAIPVTPPPMPITPSVTLEPSMEEYLEMFTKEFDVKEEKQIEGLKDIYNILNEIDVLISNINRN